MSSAVDSNIQINVKSIQDKNVPKSKAFPCIELTKESRKVVLVRLPYEMIYGVYGKLPKNHEVRPPLGLLYVAGALEEAGHQVHVIDAEPQMFSPDEIFRLIMEKNPDIIGFTSTTPEFFGVVDLVKRIKKSQPNVKVMVGGSHVSAQSKDVVKNHSEIDYIVVGEGELAAVHICNHLPKGRIFRAREIDSADDVPFPARHLVDYKWYKYAMPGKGMIAMDVIETIRGCPFMCTFCSVRGGRPRKRDVVKVVDEIEHSYLKYNTKLFMFFDDTLTVFKDRVFELCDEIIKRGLHKKIVFYANTRANTTTDKMLDKMIEAGLTEISMGVETGSEKMLAAIQKGCKLNQYRQVYKWMYERGLQTRASFIVGLPNETHKTVRQTVNFAKDLDLMRISVNILTPYPGTVVYQQALDGDGLHLLCKDWKEFKRYGSSVIRTDGLSSEDLKWYQRRFLTEFYTQPKVLWYHLKQFLSGNFSLYYYRPVLFAIKNRIKDFWNGANPPTLRKGVEDQSR